MRKTSGSVAFISVCAMLIHTLAYSAPTTAPTTSLAPMLRQVMPSVVNLKVIYAPKPVMHNEKDNPIIIPEQQSSVASGVIIDGKQGYLLTNNHVVSGAEEIIVTLSDGRTFRAKPVGGDPDSDIAVIQIEANDLTAIALGDSDDLAVGDFVVAIGNPFGLEHSVTSGIISGLGRANLGIESYENYIQTDASINPGNSGGALVDLNGKLIGINTAILSTRESPANIGIGLAIPVNMAHSIMLQLVKFGEVRRGLLGVIAQPITPELAPLFGRTTTSGALVAYIAPDSLAQQTGLRNGDIVTTINGKKMADATQLRNTLGLIPIDTEVSMTVIRDQTEKVFTFTMAAPKSIITQWEQISPLFDGIELGRFDQDVPGHGYVQGLQIFSLNPDSVAAQAQLIPGDIIESINGQPVTDLLSLKKAVALRKPTEPLLLHVVRNKGAFYTALKN